MSLLNPGEAVVGAVALGTMVVGIYSVALPHAVDVRVAAENDDTIASAEKLAAWTSAGAVAGLSFLLRDPTMFVTGGLMIIALSWWYRHANAVNPAVGKAVGGVLPNYNLGEVAPDYNTIG